MKKKLAIGLAASAMIGTLAVGGTLAWLTDTETVSNVVTVGNVNVTWLEKGPNQESFTEITGSNTGIQYGTDVPVTPGSSLIKESKIKNTGKNAAFVRAKIEYKEKTPGTEDYTTKEKPEYLTYQVKNDTAWEKSGDYYYYTEILGKETETDLLLEKLLISTDATNSDIADKDFKVELTAEVIQADNTGVTISGDHAADATALAEFFQGKSIANYTAAE